MGPLESRENAPSAAQADLAGSADRSHDEFLRLFIRHNKQIFAFIITLVPNYNDAEDILQETASVMWNKFDQYEAGTNFLAWARQIARFKVMRHREKGKQAVIFDAETLGRIISAQERDAGGLEDRLEALRSCVQKLGREDIYLIRAHYQEGIPIKQIAEQANRSVHTFYKRMACIFALLQRCVRRTLSAWECGA